MAGVGEDGYEEVCSFEALKAEGKKRVTVKGRIIVLFYANEVVHALDHFCYRKQWSYSAIYIYARTDIARLMVHGSSCMQYSRVVHVVSVIA